MIATCSAPATIRNAPKSRTKTNMAVVTRLKGERAKICCSKGNASIGSCVAMMASLMRFSLAHNGRRCAPRPWRRPAPCAPRSPWLGAVNGADRVAGLHDVDDRAGGPAFASDLRDGLMEIGIELAIAGVDRLDPVALERREQLSFRRFDAFDDGLYLRVCRFAHRGRKMGEGAGEIVGDGQHLARKSRHGIGAGIGSGLLGAAARVFRVLHRAHNLFP